MLVSEILVGDVSIGLNCHRSFLISFWKTARSSFSLPLLYYVFMCYIWTHTTDYTYTHP